MYKPVITFVFKVLRNGLLRYILYSKCYAMDCFGTYFTHVQTCDNVGVQSATQSTASVHTLHMSKPVITFVFKVLRNRLLRYIHWHMCLSLTSSLFAPWMIVSEHRRELLQQRGFLGIFFGGCHQWVWRQHETQGDDPHSFLQKLRTLFWCG